LSVEKNIFKFEPGEPPNGNKHDWPHFLHFTLSSRHENQIF